MRSRIHPVLAEQHADAMSKRVATLEEENAQLRAALAGGQHVGRRSALRLGGVAAAVGAGSWLLRPHAAGATTGALQFGQQNDAGGDSTLLTSTNATATLQVSNGAGAPAVRLRSGGAALVATGADAGVLGITSGAGAGLLGRADAGTGPAVRAEIGVDAATVAAIEAAQDGSGDGVDAHIDNPASTGSALHGQTKGAGAAVLASIDNAASRNAAVRAQTNGLGAGLAATSAQGVGGRFAGKTAPIQLVPSSASSHPAGGTAGQLFVDHANRLWFCKGGTNWRQLA